MSMLNDYRIDSYGNYILIAKNNSKNYGKTTLYKFIDDEINNRIGGGISMPNATNIILIYGVSGSGKSTVALNIIASAIRIHKKNALLLLEDDPGIATYKLMKMVGEQTLQQARDYSSIFGPDQVKTSYSKKDALELIEKLFKDGYDLVVIDHLQFLFEATSEPKDEYQAQRVFIRELNRISKIYQKTIVLVSHVNKTAQSMGYSLDSTTGSNSVGQVATKALAIYRNEDKQLCMRLEKSRYTKNYWDDIPIEFDENFNLVYDRNIDNKKLKETLDNGFDMENY